MVAVALIFDLEDAVAPRETNVERPDCTVLAKAKQGRNPGLDDSTLIRPAQLALATAVLATSAVDMDSVRRQIRAFSAAQKEGTGLAVLDGRIEENLHIVTARQTLAQAEAIAATNPQEA